ncbi:MAG TPA: hydrogenase maturation nickel metallochaperone HypA [Drouetiella sp.]|jgi:hydrogenase nickel insertion protein HypA
MHEASIARAILQSATSKLNSTPNAVQLKLVQIEVGEFSNVDSESLQFAFDNMRELFQGASACELQIDAIQAQAICQNHNHLYRPDFEHAFCCTICGSGIGKLLRGEELNIINMRLETHLPEGAKQCTTR